MRYQSHLTNPTSITNIPKQNVRIAVNVDETGRRETFSLAFLSFEGLGLSDDARVWIWAEAGYDSLSFDFGTVASLSTPPDTSVRDLDQTKPLKFRVTVFPDGDPLLLATCENISASNSTDPADVLPILPVEVLSLGDRIWEVSGPEGDRPVLKVTDDPDIDAANRILNDPVFQALILPDAFRQAIEHTFLNDPDSPDPDDWANLWKRRIESMGGSYPPDIDREAELEIRDWSTELADRFARELNLKSNLKHQLAGNRD